MGSAVSKVIKVSLDPASIQNAINEVENYKRWLHEKTQEFLHRLAQRGCENATWYFSNAVYDGTNDVTCEIRENGDNMIAVVATGKATLFIEFGTGVLFPDNHPENTFERGGYGAGRGSNPGGWNYQGDPGTFGKASKSGWVHTYGNPANMSMYQAIRDVEREFTEIAREVFV